MLSKNLVYRNLLPYICTLHIRFATLWVPEIEMKIPDTTDLTTKSNLHEKVTATKDKILDANTLIYEN